MAPSYEDVAQVIRDIRRETELTQEEFGKRLGVTGPTVSRWESGHQVPTSANIREIARVFDKRADLLIRRIRGAAESAVIEKRLQEALGQGGGEEGSGMEVGEHTIRLEQDGSLIVNESVKIFPPT